MLSTQMHRVLMEVTPAFGMGLFLRQDLKRLVAESLDETNRWQRRRAPLTAPLVVFFVLSMAWFRSRSISRLMKLFFLWMRGIVPELSLCAVTPEAMCHARKRLGVEPMKALYQKLAASAKEPARFLGLRTWAIDGVHLTMPDTPANVEEFGKPSASRGSAAFPQMLAVALVNAGTHSVRDVVLARNDAAERTACKEIVNRLAGEPSLADELVGADCEQVLGRLGAEDLLMMDRGFAGVWLFKVIMDRKAHLLCRIPAGWKPKIIKRLGPGDWLVKVTGPEISPREAQRMGLKGEIKNIVLTLRMIEYRVGADGERVRLLTDLLDPHRYPAKELAPGYHLRWEGELCYDEIKNHLATVNHGALHTVLRSKSPDGVLQEVYGLFAAYNLVRAIMLEAAQEHDVPPLEISFTEALDVIQNALPEFERASLVERPQLIERLLADIAACRLARPRRPRLFPRVVRVKMSNWKLKRAQHRQELVDFALELKLCG